MKSKIFIFLIVLITTVFSSSAITMVEQGDSAYSKDNFNKALSIYLEVAKKDGVSSELYYNIGNTYYRLGNLGKSIIYYERALLLNPKNEDAKTNLEFVNDKIIDQSLTPSTNIITEFIHSIMMGQSSNSWAVIAIVSFILFVLSGMLYIFARSVIYRKIGFFGCFTLLVVIIVTNVFAYKVKENAINKSTAIVTIKSVTLSTSPRIPKDKSEEAFILNEGTKLTIVDSVTNKIGTSQEKWYDVKADDAHRAWINASNIEII